jgi:hypothetical protein
MHNMHTRVVRYHQQVPTEPPPVNMTLLINPQSSVVTELRPPFDIAPRLVLSSPPQAASFSLDILCRYIPDSDPDFSCHLGPSLHRIPDPSHLDLAFRLLAFCFPYGLPPQSFLGPTPSTQILSTHILLHTRA